MHRKLYLFMGAFLLAVSLLPSNLRAASYGLSIFEESLQNGDDCSSTGGQPGSPVRTDYVSVVHSGTYSVGVQDYMGVAFRWCSTTTYSAVSDYDGISFWVNGGMSGGETVVLSVLDAVGDGDVIANATLAQLYGAPIPAATWVNINVPFSSPLFTHPSESSSFNTVTFAVVGDTSNAFFVLDDVFLSAADVFKSGFDEPTGAQHLVINEVDYDNIGTDDMEFIELYNPSRQPISLDSLALVLINGSNNSEYARINLASAGSVINPGQYLVAKSSLLDVAGGVLAINFDSSGANTDHIQNGAPDGLAIIDTASQTIVDALSYEGAITAAQISGFAGTSSLVEGAALPITVADSTSVAGSLIRSPNAIDTDNAATDWKFSTNPTPGAANIP